VHLAKASIHITFLYQPLLFNIMDYLDVLIIFRLAMKYFHQQFDPLYVIDEAKRYKFIGKRKTRKMKTKYAKCLPGTTTKEMFSEFIWDLLPVLTFEQLTILLASMGCQPLVKELQEVHRPGRIFCAKRYSTHLVAFHKNLKSLLDDNGFVDKVRALENLAMVARLKLARTVNLEARQNDANELSIVMWLRAQQFRDETQDQRMSILNEMMAGLPNDIDNSLAHVIALTQTAVNFALLGRVEASLAVVQEVKQLVDSCDEQFAVSVACHDIQYVFRILYDKTKDKAYLDKVLEECDLGIQSLEQVIPDDRMLLERLFKLNMTQSLLSITPQLDINDELPCSTVNRLFAQSLTQQVRNQHFQGIEKRREFIYMLSVARLNELENNIELALEYATRAVAILEDGLYFANDLDRAESFLRRIYQKALPIEVV